MSLIISQPDMKILNRYDIKNFQQQLQAVCANRATAPAELDQIFIKSIQAISVSLT